jgi:hypothetical protein
MRLQDVGFGLIVTNLIEISWFLPDLLKKILKRSKEEDYWDLGSRQKCTTKKVQTEKL